MAELFGIYRSLEPEQERAVIITRCVALKAALLSCIGSTEKFEVTASIPFDDSVMVSPMEHALEVCMNALVAMDIRPDDYILDCRKPPMQKIFVDLN